MSFMQDKPEQDIFLKQMLNLTGLVIMLLVNFLANWLPINNVTTGEVSDQYLNIFTPAGFTFSIWGLIYLALIILVIYLFRGLKTSGEKASHFIERIGLLFFISSLFNAAWIFAWHYFLIELSLIFMLGLLISLIIIYRRIKASIDFGWLAVPFSIYLGWISVATIANIVAWQTTIEWDMLGLSEEIWLVILLAAVILLTFGFLRQFKDLAFTLVILWSLTGIFVERASQQSVISLAPLAAAISFVIIVLVLFYYYDFSRLIRS